MMKTARQTVVNAPAHQAIAPISGSTEQYAKLVQAALVGVTKGDQRGYNFVIQNMCPGLRSTEKIDRPLTIPLVWLQALTQSASLIKTPNCEALLNVLHAFDWAADKEIVSAYANLLLNLISSDVCHLAPTFQSIARNFLPRRSHNSLVSSLPGGLSRYTALRLLHT